MISDAAKYYVRECADHALRLPLEEARLFLRGALELGTDANELGPLRVAFRRLDDCAEQLELIARDDIPASPAATRKPAARPGRRP